MFLKRIYLQTVFVNVVGIWEIAFFPFNLFTEYRDLIKQEYVSFFELVVRFIFLHLSHL